MLQLRNVCAIHVFGHRGAYAQRVVSKKILIFTRKIDIFSGIGSSTSGHGLVRFF